MMSDKYDVDIDKSLNELKMFISSDSTYVPDFIDNKISSHKQCYTIFSYLLNYLDRIIVNEVVSKKRMVVIVSYINSLFTDMVMVNEEITVMYYNYLHNMLEYYKSYCTDMELFEVIININNLIEQVFDIKLEKDNEDK